MLMVMRVDVGCNSGTVRVRLAVRTDINLQDPRKTDFELDGSILIKVVVPDVL